MARVLVSEKIADKGLDQLREAGHDVDVQLDLDEAGLLEAIQGAHALIIRSATTVTPEVLDAGRAATGHIFNLGHGVMPSTDPDQLARLTDFVHEHSAR